MREGGAVLEQGKISNPEQGEMSSGMSKVMNDAANKHRRETQVDVK